MIFGLANVPISESAWSNAMIAWAGGNAHCEEF